MWPGLVWVRLGDGGLERELRKPPSNFKQGLFLGTLGLFRKLEAPLGEQLVIVGVRHGGPTAYSNQDGGGPISGSFPLSSAAALL